MDLNNPNIIVLKEEPLSYSSNVKYKVILERNKTSGESWQRTFDGHFILKILSSHKESGRFDLTPGQWYLDTLLGYDTFGRRLNTDFIYIDAGQEWRVGNMQAILKEAEEIVYGKLDEGEEPRFVPPFRRDNPDMRNWYQKPENKAGYKKPSPPRKKRMTTKQKEKIEEYQYQIQDLEYEIRCYEENRIAMEREGELFSGEIISDYDWKVLDILNSGYSDEEKKEELDKWNMEQDRMDKTIPNTKNLIKQYNNCYSDHDKTEEKIVELESEIEKLQKKIDDIEKIYESTILVKESILLENVERKKEL